MLRWGFNARNVYNTSHLLILVNFPGLGLGPNPRLTETVFPQKAPKIRAPIQTKLIHCGHTSHLVKSTDSEFGSHGVTTIHRTSK